VGYSNNGAYLGFYATGNQAHDNNPNTNEGAGIALLAFSDSYAYGNISGNTASSNEHGILVVGNGLGVFPDFINIYNLTVSDNNASNNDPNGNRNLGIGIVAQNGGVIGYSGVVVNNNTANSNDCGICIVSQGTGQAQVGVGGTQPDANRISVTNNTANSNIYGSEGVGILFYAGGDATLGANVSGNSATGNEYGIFRGDFSSSSCSANGAGGGGQASGNILDDYFNSSDPGTGDFTDSCADGVA